MNTDSTPSPSRASLRSLALVTAALAAVYGVARVVDDPAMIGMQPEETWTVTGHRWSRSTAVMQLGTWTMEDWCGRLPQYPGATDVRRSKKQTGETQQVTVRELCRDNDFKTDCMPVYEDRPVEDWWCAFTWEGAKEVRRAELSGEDLDPEWPRVRPGDGETEGKRTELYEVTFRQGEQTARCAMPQARWRLISVGSIWTATAEPGRALACDTLTEE